MKPASARIPPCTPPGAASVILPRFPLPGNERASKSSAPSSCGRYGFIICGTAYSNAETYLAFLQNLARRYRRQGAILIHDNASYHTKPLVQSWLDVNRDWLEVKSLPKYSPELNPTERIWQYTRKNGTHNRYFENERALVSTLTRTFGEMQTYPQLIRPSILPFL